MTSPRHAAKIALRSDMMRQIQAKPAELVTHGESIDETQSMESWASVTRLSERKSERTGA